MSENSVLALNKQQWIFLEVCMVRYAFGDNLSREFFEVCGGSVRLRPIGPSLEPITDLSGGSVQSCIKLYTRELSSN